MKIATTRSNELDVDEHMSTPSEIGLVPLGTSAFDHKRISRLMDAGGL